MDQPNLNKHNTDIVRFGLGRLSWKKRCLRRASKFWRRRYERLHHPHPSQRSWRRLGIRGFNPKLKNAADRLETLQMPEGGAIPPNTLAGLKRDFDRQAFICDQIRRIEQERIEHLERAPNTGPNVMVRLLARVIGIGIETADLLVHEVLLRSMRDRRAVGRYGGLTGSPERSGSMSREKGLARSGNARVRRAMVQLAWRFLLFQKPWRNGIASGPGTPRKRARP